MAAVLLLCGREIKIQLFDWPRGQKQRKICILFGTSSDGPSDSIYIALEQK